jgi:hypothetical protein
MRLLTAFAGAWTGLMLGGLLAVGAALAPDGQPCRLARADGLRRIAGQRPLTG